MIVDLVRTTTSDGMRLDGVVHQAESSSMPQVSINAVICLHGVGGSFYSGSMFENLASKITPLGVDLLCVNTRGHDSIHTASYSGEAKRQGAAFERVDECRYDIDAWINFLLSRGHQRIALLGHSLGAIKAVYAQAHQPHEAVCGVIAISPPRLSGPCFQHGPESPRYFESMQTAEQMVQQGRGEELFGAKFPFPLMITAAGYVDKYGPAERYNIVKFVDQLSCPTLFIYGGSELEKGGIAFAGVPEALATAGRESQKLEFATIPQADHMYTGKHDQLSAEVCDWLQRRFPAAQS